MSSWVDFKRYQQLHDSLLQSFEQQRENEYFNYSELWKRIFNDRSAARELSDLLVSLNDVSTSIEGMTGKISKEERAMFVDYYKSFLSAETLNTFPISWLGAPTVFDFEEKPASVPYLQNLYLFIEAKTLLEKHCHPVRPFHILEIGAGYGAVAYSFVQAGLAKSYTILDLPENLTISTFYLSQNFQDKSCLVLSQTNSAPLSERKDFNFVTPGNIDTLKDWNFDLIINSDSLGEMKADTAKAYMNFIYNHLIDSGYFFTKNGHSRGIDCIQYPHEFNYQKMKFLELCPPSIISSLFDDFSHYALLQKSLSAREPYPNAYFDAICSLYAVGIQDEAREISAAFANHKLNEDQKLFLTMLDQFFTAKNLREKLTCLKNFPPVKTFNSVLLYLEGISRYLMGNLKEATPLFEAYRKTGESYIAEAYTLMALSKKDPSVLLTPFKHGAKTRYAINELLKFRQMPYPLKEVAWRLRADALRKKIFYSEYYSPSTLLKTKNILFNLREGKGFKLTR